mmetsp:Transcript_16163/g.40889  ORF Transcript_16163/g.40889 Transcript_16163/m.40889 type:complete len:672 (-) Transcript_16163:605-2620(-)
MGSLHLCEGSFISPEEGVAELRMEEGIEYVGGWKGRVGFDPLPTVSPSQLSRSLFRVGGMAGAGRLSVDSSCTVPHLPSPLSLSPGEEYAGNFRDSLPHGMGRWVKRSVRDDGSVVRTETICYFSAGKANGPALVVKGVYASKEEEEEDKLVEGVFDALLPRRRQGGSSSRRGGGGGEGGMSGERGREGRGGAKGWSRKVECYHFDMGKKGMKTVLLWPFVFSLLLTFGVKMNEVYRVGAKTRRVKRECGYVASKKEGGGKGGKGRHEADVPKLQKPSIENSLFGWYLPAFLMSWFYVHEEVEMGAFGWVYLVIGSLPLPLLLMSEQVRVLSKSKDDYQNPLCMTNFFWSTMASWFSLFMLRLYSLLPPHLTPLTAAFLFFFFGTAASFVWARRADPGYLPRRHHPLTQAEIAELRQGGMLSKVCITCAIHKPPRSKHCKHCDRCVDILDHHCGALSHCVGSQNRISFITYVFLLDVAMVLYAVLVLKFASYKVHASAEVGISEWIGKIFSLLFRYHFTLFCHLIWIALFLVMYLSLLADHVGVMKEEKGDEQVERVVHRPLSLCDLRVPAFLFVFSFICRNAHLWLVHLQALTTHPIMHVLTCTSPTSPFCIAAPTHSPTHPLYSWFVHLAMANVGANGASKHHDQRESELEKVQLSAKAERKEGRREGR